MKLIRRTLSLLLSAALIAQMSFVLAFAAPTPATCGAAGHGFKTAITEACTDNVPHRLTGNGTLTGSNGSSSNSFVVKPNAQVTCGNGIDTIVADTKDFAAAGTVTVSMFDPTKDKIYIVGDTPAVVPTSGTDTKFTVTAGNITLTLNFTVATEATAVSNAVTTGQLMTFKTSIAAETITVAKGVTVKQLDATVQHFKGTPMYQWTKDNTPIVTATTATYTPPATAIGSAVYQCVVSDAADTLTSGAVTVTVTGCDVTATLKDLATVAAIKTTTDTTVALTSPLNVPTGLACNTHTGDNTHGYSVVWTLSDATKGITVNGQSLNVVAANLPTASTSLTLTATLHKDGVAVSPAVTKTTNFTVQKGEACDATPTLSTVSAPVTTGSTLNVSSNMTTAAPTTNFSVNAGTCNTATHLGTPSVANHGYKVTWTLTPAVLGVSIDANTGVMTITHASLSTTDVTATLTATVSGGTSAPSASASITFHKETVCTAVPQSVAITGVDTINADSITTKTYTATVTYNPPTCGVAGHTTNAHGATVAWALTDSTGAAATMAGVSLNPTTGVLTITKANLLKYSNDIYIKATATKGSNAPTASSAPFAVTITRSCKGVATKVDINNIASFSAGSATGDTTKSLSAAVTSTGCEAPGTHDHTALTWSIDGALTWVKFDTNSNTLRVTNNSVPTTGNTITIRATTKDGVVGTKSITISRYSSGGSSSDDTSSDETQWEEVYDRVLDADSGDVLTANLGSNTEMPGYLFNKLRGKNVALKLSVDNGYTWTVNGKTITKVPSYQIYIPLDVDSYSNTRMFKLAREYDVKAFQLRHEGSFFSDMKLTIPVSADYDNKTLYLYSYNEDTNKLTYRSSAKVNGDSDVTFTFKSSVGNYLLTSKALYGENATGGGGGAITPPPATSKPASTSSVPPSTSSSTPSTSASSVPPSTSSAPSSVPAPDSKPESQPTDVKPEKEKSKFPILVPILIVAILGVIVAVVLIARGGSGKGGMTFDD